MISNVFIHGGATGGLGVATASAAATGNERLVILFAVLTLAMIVDFILSFRRETACKGHSDA